MKLRWLVVGIGSVLLLCGHAAEKNRSFTSSDGKTITAKLLDVEGGKAKLLLKSGRATLVPLARLSEADQAYVKNWAERYKSKLPLGAIQMEFDKEESFERPAKEDKKKEDKDKKKIKRTTTTSYSLKLDNATNEEIKEVEVYFRVFKAVNRNAGKTEVEEASMERWDIGDLKSKESVDTNSRSFMAVDWVEGSRRQSEKTFGILADVVVGGVFYRRFGYPSNAESYVKENFKMRGKEWKEPDYGADQPVASEPEEEEFD